LLASMPVCWMYSWRGGASPARTRRADLAIIRVFFRAPAGVFRQAPVAGGVRTAPEHHETDVVTGEVDRGVAAGRECHRRAVRERPRGCGPPRPRSASATLSRLVRAGSTWFGRSKCCEEPSWWPAPAICSWRVPTAVRLPPAPVPRPGRRRLRISASPFSAPTWLSRCLRCPRTGRGPARCRSSSIHHRILVGDHVRTWPGCA